MTELIVALDGPLPYLLMEQLISSDVNWFKVGPLTWTDSVAMVNIDDVAKHAKSISFFYDAKLAGHGPYVCSELAKRLGGSGYASISTSTDAATAAALKGADGTPLKIWRHVAPTSLDVPRPDNEIVNAARQGVHGFILGAWHLQSLNTWLLGGERNFDVVCPAVRMDDFSGDDHVKTMEPKNCNQLGVTHAVIGRPIWQATDPATVAKRYLEALG